jgi:hypothetical protein
MKRLTSFLGAVAVTAVAGLAAPPSLYADDIDLYLWKPPSTPETRPNILFMFSAANTMLYELRYKEDTMKEINGTLTNVQGRKTGISRMDALKEAVLKVLDAVDGVNIGFGRFVASGGSNTPILYPVRYVNDAIEISGTGVAADQISNSANDVEETEDGAVLISDAVLEMVQQPSLQGGGSCNGATNNNYYYTKTFSIDHAYQQTSTQAVTLVPSGTWRAGSYAATAWLEWPESTALAAAPANEAVLPTAYWQYLSKVSADEDDDGEFIKVPFSQSDVPWTKKKIFGDWESPYVMLDNPDTHAGQLIKVASSVAVTKTGSGDITGTVDGTTVINCGSQCSNSNVTDRKTMILTATPVSGWRFGSWGGSAAGCGTSSTCSLAVGNKVNLAISATFLEGAGASLTINPAPVNGMITSSPSGINCGSSGSACTNVYAVGTSVTLTATPASGYVFAGWGGEVCSGLGPCTLTLNENTALSATFALPGLISGLRYHVAGIPQGSTIRCAELKMTAQGSWDIGGGGLNMRMKAESTPSAAPFAATEGDLTEREAINAGTFELKNIDASTSPVVTISNTNLTASLQTLVNHPQWSDRSSVALFIDKTQASTAELEFDRGVSLTLAWEPPAGVTPESGGNQLLGLRFEDIAVPSKVTITDARLSFTSGAAASGNANISIRAEKPWRPLCDADGNVLVDESNNPRMTDDLLPFTEESLSSRINCHSGAALTDAFDWAITEAWTQGSEYSTPSAMVAEGETAPSGTQLKDVIQQIVNQDGWCGGVTPLHLLLSATNENESPLRNIVSYDGNAGSAPRIVISYDSASTQADSCITQTYRGRILESVDDAEEALFILADQGGNGFMNLISTRLELVKTTGNTGEGSGDIVRVAGFRFQSVPVKRNTPIDKATITFKASSNSTGDASLLIFGQKGDAPRFEVKPWNISDRITSSTKPTSGGVMRDLTTNPKDSVTAPLEWTMLAANGTGDDGTWRTNVQGGLYSVDVTEVVQEIVNSGEWRSYSNMGFYIAPNGNNPGLREVISYDANTGKTESAFLEITVKGLLGEEGSGAITRTVRDHLKQVTRELRACYSSQSNACSQLIIDALHESGLYYLGGKVEGGKSRNNDVYNRVSHRDSFINSDICYGGGCKTAEAVGCMIDVMPYEAACAGESLGSHQASRYVSPIASNCSPNHIILISDGEATANTVSGLGSAFPGTDVNVATELAAMGFYGGCAFQGSSTATTYAGQAHFFDDNGNKTLDAGERRFGDYNNSGGRDGGELTYGLIDSQNESCGPDIATYLNHKHNIKTHVISFALGTGWQTNGPDGEPLVIPAAIDTTKTNRNERSKEFLRYLAHRGGGFFYEAEDADELANAIMEIISKILSDSASFVAPTLSVNTFNKLYHDDEVYFALFQPSFQHRWAGNIKKYKFNECTDTSNCATELVDKEGKPISYKDDPNTDERESGLHPNAVELWNTAEISYVGTACTTVEQKLNPAACGCIGCDGPVVIQAGAGAQVPVPLTRNVYTEKPLSGVAGQKYELVKIGSDDFNSDLISNVDLGVPANDSAARTKMVNWILGMDVDDEDEDGMTDDQRWVFGDPLHSQPVLITYGQDSNQKSVSKLFVATNEGVVRMLNADTGEEEWAFMPSEMVKRQKLFRENPVFGEQRIYGIDGMPVFLIQDRNQNGIIEPTGAVDGNGVPTGDFVWMFIGERRGGRNLYAFDITPAPGTDAATLKAGSAANPSFVPKLKWIIKGGEGNFANLGQTWSTPIPAIVKYKGTDPSNPDVQWIGRAVLLFGGGYDDSLDEPNANPRSSNMGNAIYMVSTNTGELLWWAGKTGSGANLELDGMDYPIPSDLMVMDSDGDGFEDRIYVGDTGGQVWRIDLGNTIDGNIGNAGTSGNSIGGMLADLTPASCSSESLLPVGSNTPYTNNESYNCYRRFFYPPAVVRLPDTDYFNGGYHDAVVITSGHRPAPLDTGIIDRIYVLRDRARFALTPTGADEDGNVTDGRALQDEAGFIFPLIPDSAPGVADYGVVGITADDVAITSPKLNISVDKSTVKNSTVEDATLFFTITENLMFDATDNQMQDGSNDTELGNVFVDDNALKQLKAAPGWYITLTDKGEKGLSRPLVVEGRAFITTFIPSGGGLDANGCPLLDEGFGRLYALDLLAGRAVTDWDPTTGDPHDDMDDLSRSDRSRDLGLGIPASPQALFRPDGVSILTTDDGAPEIDPDKFVLPKDRIYWLEQ